MPHTVTKRRSRIATLTVLAVLASLFALLMAPAGAVDIKASADLAVYKACPSGVAPAAGFTDVSSTSFAKDDIDCIKYFGVTDGTSATTYSPGDSVTREQMALFLIRAAGPSGITVPAASSPGFHGHFCPAAGARRTPLTSLPLSVSPREPRQPPTRRATRSPVSRWPCSWRATPIRLLKALEEQNRRTSLLPPTWSSPTSRM